MNINETVKGIFIKLAKKMGLELSEKSKNDIDFTADGLNPTAIGSGVVANIAIDDSDIIIDGTNSLWFIAASSASNVAAIISNSVAQTSNSCGAVFSTINIIKTPINFDLTRVILWGIIDMHRI